MQGAIVRDKAGTLCYVYTKQPDAMQMSWSFASANSDRQNHAGDFGWAAELQIIISIFLRNTV